MKLAGIGHSETKPSTNTVLIPLKQNINLSSLSVANSSAQNASQQEVLTKKQALDNLKAKWKEALSYIRQIAQADPSDTEFISNLQTAYQTAKAEIETIKQQARDAGATEKEINDAEQQYITTESEVNRVASKGAQQAEATLNAYETPIQNDGEDSLEQTNEAEAEEIVTETSEEAAETNEENTSSEYSQPMSFSDFQNMFEELGINEEAFLANLDTAIGNNKFLHATYKINGENIVAKIGEEEITVSKTGELLTVNKPEAPVEMASPSISVSKNTQKQVENKLKQLGVKYTATLQADGTLKVIINGDENTYIIFEGENGEATEFQGIGKIILREIIYRNNPEAYISFIKNLSTEEQLYGKFAKKDSNVQCTGTFPKPQSSEKTSQTSETAAGNVEYVTDSETKDIEFTPINNSPEATEETTTAETATITEATTEETTTAETATITEATTEETTTAEETTATEETATIAEITAVEEATAAETATTEEATAAETADVQIEFANNLVSALKGLLSGYNISAKAYAEKENSLYVKININNQEYEFKLNKSTGEIESYPEDFKNIVPNWIINLFDTNRSLISYFKITEGNINQLECNQNGSIVLKRSSGATKLKIGKEEIDGDIVSDINDSSLKNHDKAEKMIAKINEIMGNSNYPTIYTYKPCVNNPDIHVVRLVKDKSGTTHTIEFKFDNAIDDYIIYIKIDGEETDFTLEQLINIKNITGEDIETLLINYMESGVYSGDTINYSFENGGSITSYGGSISAFKSAKGINFETLKKLIPDITENSFNIYSSEQVRSAKFDVDCELNWQEITVTVDGAAQKTYLYYMGEFIENEEQ